MRFSIYQESKKGGRRINQDRMGYLYTRDSLILMVADGMGGHARGEVAAQLTLQTLASIYQRDAKPILADPARYLEEAVLASHRELHRYRAEHTLPEAPRTTLVVAIVQRGMVIWAHVGDSRLYLIRGGRIADRTVDHSRVHHLISSGLIRPEEAKDHPERNRIFNCIGAFVAPTVEISRPVALRSGDSLLLCSDGLWGSVNDKDIADAFADKTLMRGVPELIELALANGGKDADNCTALAMTWAGSESSDMIPPTEAPVSTLVMPEGAVASTIQIPRAGDPEPTSDLTDEKIDEAVAEIQRAIQRSNKLIEGQ
ncbi:MAG TPA: protein phosphatase 2C domain-containing protein [Burkholderiaceae bacterium]|nr:protein phosphatase 2C domain-containing protein [Burkholderiaceae bacterium]